MAYPIIAALIAAAIAVIAAERQRRPSPSATYLVQERLKAMLEYEAKIRLPEGRDLTPLSEDEIVVDLSVSRVANLILFEPKENVAKVLGSPLIHEDITEMYIYPHRGMSFQLIRHRIRAVNLWLTNIAASRTLSKELPDFAPCKVVVAGRGDGTYRIRPGDTRSSIVSALGKPDNEEGPYIDGVTLLTYFGNVCREGDHRLHLEFNLEADGKLSSIYITH